MKPMSYTNSIDLEVQDVSKYPIHGMQTSITTISSMTASGGPPLATASIINPKVTSSTIATSSTIHSVDKIIEFPSLIEKTKSYQQQQQIQYDGSTINHNNNIVLTPAHNSFSLTSSGKLGPMDGASLQLSSSYNAVASLTTNDKVTAKTYKPPQVSPM